MSTVSSFLLFTLAFFFGWVCGSEKNGKSMQSKAIQQNCAEYYLDANNEKQFRWKTNK
jgi:hypothetical protein